LISNLQGKLFVISNMHKRKTTWKRHFSVRTTSNTRSRHLIVVELFGRSDWPWAWRHTLMHSGWIRDEHTFIFIPRGAFRFTHMRAFIYSIRHIYYRTRAYAWNGTHLWSRATHELGESHTCLL